MTNSRLCNDEILELRPSSLCPPKVPSELAEGLDILNLDPDLADSHHELIRVATRNAYCTIPEVLNYPTVNSIYLLFLMSAWIWDDVVDRHNQDPALDSLISAGLDEFRRVVNTAAGSTVWSPEAEATRVEVDSVVNHGLWDELQTAKRLLADAAALIELELPEFAPRIYAEMRDFYRSFRQKSRLGHRPPSLAHYKSVRRTCVGVAPCLEIAYATNARAAGIEASTLLEYLQDEHVDRCAELAALHCGAVNDLFSMYKDRQEEQIPNFPLLMAPTHDVDGYLEGGRRTLKYVRSLITEFWGEVDQLPASAACAKLVTQTHTCLMEGTVSFHLGLPRYAEGVELLRSLVTQAPAEQLSAFRTSLLPPGNEQGVPECYDKALRAC